MKVMCTSDLHGNLDNLEDFISQVDTVALAGDIAELKGRGKWHIHDQKKWMEKKFIPFCLKYPEKPFIFIPGNHDFFPLGSQRFPDLNFNITWPNNVHMLIDQAFTYNGKTFYGSPWVPIISHSWSFEADTDVQKANFSKIPQNLDLLITHSPPHLGSDKFIDRSLQFGFSEPFGSNALANAILDKKPRYAICGHIHSGDHKCYEFFNTKVYNVSRLDENYEIAYDPLILDI